VSRGFIWELLLLATASTRQDVTELGVLNPTTMSSTKTRTAFHRDKIEREFPVEKVLKAFRRDKIEREFPVEKVLSRSYLHEALSNEDE
jgi:hypothetical protein